MTATAHISRSAVIVRAVYVLGLATLGARAVVAQNGMFITAGRVLAGTPAEASWHLTLEQGITGPLGADYSLVVLPGSRPASGDLYGAGADLALFSGARGIPTFFAGVTGGIGVGGQQHLWAGGSFGARMPVVVLGPLRLMAEGRWRVLTIEGRNGLEVGAALGYHTRRRTEAQPERAGLWVPPPTADVLRSRGIPDAKARLLGNIVTTALDEMGQPYVWGGTGNGNGGFDCSGLIQYAYARYNISIPRTAAGQATAGIAIRQDIEALLPGDILIFSERGDQPTHVGLYVGEGRFIHSASKGVRLSRLTEDDVEGRGWLRRWTGVRRIVE